MYSKCSKEELLAFVDEYNNLRKQRELTKNDCEHLHAISVACNQYDDDMNLYPFLNRHSVSHTLCDTLKYKYDSKLNHLGQLQYAS